jgi:catabolite regulation protein CreA
MEETVKLRLLLTSALFMFVQIATMHAQETGTVDVAKITCQQVILEQLAPPTHDIVMWLSGYYNGKRDNMIINFETIKNDEQKVRLYCYQNPETTVLDAIKNVLGLDNTAPPRHAPSQAAPGRRQSR